jgi:hypothetical protein
LNHPHGHRGWFVHPQPVPMGGQSHPMAEPPPTGPYGWPKPLHGHRGWFSHPLVPNPKKIQNVFGPRGGRTTPWGHGGATPDHRPGVAKATPRLNWGGQRFSFFLFLIFCYFYFYFLKKLLIILVFNLSWTHSIIWAVGLN